MARDLAALVFLWCAALALAGSPLLAQDDTPDAAEPGPAPADTAPDEAPDEAPDKAPPAVTPATPPTTANELEHLARQYLGGSRAARDRLRTAGPVAVPILRGLSDDGSRQELQEFIALVAIDALEQSLKREPGLVYRGQFQACTTLGTEGVTAFLAIFRDEDQSPVARTRAAIALGDVAPGSGADAMLAPVLHDIIDDFLSEPWLEQEAGYLLVRLGDRSYVDPLIARWQEVARQPSIRTRLGELLDAHTELAEVHYRIGLYSEAIEHYVQKASILEELLGRVRDEARAGVVAEIALLYYNLACSQSLAGRFDDARASLERALPHEEVDFDMVAKDGDLRGLRAAPGHAEWLNSMRTPPTPEPEDKPEEPAAPAQ